MTVLNTNLVIAKVKVRITIDSMHQLWDQNVLLPSHSNTMQEL